MRHVSDGALRRLDDEPFAVPDSTFEHVARCQRCRARRASVAADASLAARLLSGPQLVADVDRGWDEMRRRLPGGPAVRPHRPVAAGPKRAARMSARVGVAAGVGVVAIVGTAAAATWGNVFAPTHVAPLTVNVGDLRAITGLVDMVDSSNPGGFPTPSGLGSLPFGQLRWASSGAPQQVSSAAAAETLSGLTVPAPTRLPAGVGQPAEYIVQPRVTATVAFNSTAGSLSGASVAVQAGPAVIVAYGSRASLGDVPTLGILTMTRPTATSTGATISQIEDFLLSRPGIPTALSEEIRLLGNISTVLPIPTPAGLKSETVKVGGQPAVTVSDRSGSASAVIWEDAHGVVHGVAGLVDVRSVLNVADQIG